ncbi:hypothetical protein BDY19DRAFT_995162 [Irpex rosettiformis]|uniref:Uncharacterized protein n=1 Tax=Irpex rosettiformis TaxID=378272 RepID=A0ACB8TYH6_9APHY|nr:hypothetical protein BDY19DRAFT_995162 [Irpex rosettiformis]
MSQTPKVRESTEASRNTNADSEAWWKPLKAIEVAGDTTFIQKYNWLYQEAVQERLETAWYSFYNFVVSSAIERTHNQKLKEAMMSLAPQIPLTITPWSEERPASIGDTSTTNDVNNRTYRTRTNQAADPEPFESISQAPSHVRATDDLSAVFTARLSIPAPDASSKEEEEQKDRNRFPDIGVKVAICDNISPVELSVFKLTIDSKFAPHWRVLVLFEIKRLPDLWYATGPKQLQDSENVPFYIDKILQKDMLKQVFEQVEWTFAHYPQQQRILHIGCVGDFCSLRVFRRDKFKRAMDALDKSRKAGLTDEALTWAKITGSDGKSTRLIDVDGKDFNPQFKRAWTIARQELREELKKSPDTFSNQRR